MCGKPVDERLLEVGSAQEARAGIPTEEELMALPREQQLEIALFPPPDPSFKRSLALEFQIKQLRLSPDAHYVVSVLPR